MAKLEPQSSETAGVPKDKLLSSLKDKEKAVFVEYDEKLAKAIAMKHQKFLEAVGKL